MSDKSSKPPAAEIPSPPADTPSPPVETPIYKGDALWIDQFPNDLGSVLLSDKIAYYAENHNLVVPFDRDHLRPAQYTLRVGDEGYCAGSKFKIDKENPLRIPPNGLVYIKIDEYLNIPYYMIARYSLRVDQVYRGLILDNGLQVDPGFHGHINVPVYNFTNETKTLKFQERLLSVEFVKTTAFSPNPPITSDEERYWVGSDLVNSQEIPLVVFQKNPDKLYQQKNIPGYFRDNEKNESSVLSLSNDVNEFRGEIKEHNNKMESFKSQIESRTDRLRNYNTVALVGLLLAVLVALLPFIIANRSLISDTKAKYDVLELGDKAFSEVMEEISSLQKTNEDFKNTINKYELQVTNFNESLNALVDDIKKRNDNDNSKLIDIEKKLLNLQSKLNEPKQERIRIE